MELTIDNIIELLEKQGIGSKQTVLSLLKNASVSELSELLFSIQVAINKKYARGEK